MGYSDRCPFTRVERGECSPPRGRDRSAASRKEVDAMAQERKVVVTKVKPKVRRFRQSKVHPALK